MQAVPDAGGTEIIMESTAQGVNNVFHQFWQNAVAGTNGFLPIFVSWTLQDEYRTKVPLDFALTKEESELKGVYHLDDEQIFWRRRKIAQSSLDKFHEEYPLSAEEAFIDFTGDSFIKGIDVEKARRNKDEIIQGKQHLLMGIDVARGVDKSVIALRRGRELLKMDSILNETLTVLIGWLNL
jgi:hypothetical protein